MGPRVRDRAARMHAPASGWRADMAPDGRSKVETKRLLLFTDFGEASPYLGQVRVLLDELAPGLPVLGLAADLVPYRPDLAAYLLPRLLDAMPGGNVVVCVVDPGVGGARDALAVEAGGNWFVGPDNGLLALVARRAVDAQCYRIEWRPSALSATFHGRDLFAPVAAGIALGNRAPGPAMDAAAMVGADWPDDAWLVVYQDGYGNLCTGVRAAAVSRDLVLGAGGEAVRFARTFSGVAPGAAFWFENSFGLVEIAVNQGHAATRLGLTPGAVVQRLA